MKNLFIRIKALILVLALLASSLLFIGCAYSGYKGDLPELYSVAWKNIPTLYGYTSNGEAIYDAEVEILETDNYGRVLFSYSEVYRTYDGIAYYILIMQKTEGERAYYYPDDCYIYVLWKNEDELINLNSNDISELKTLNDWNKPIDESKCESTEIIRKKLEGEIKVSNDYFENIVREYHENSGRYIHPKNSSFVYYFKFGTSDECGREMYVIYTRFEEFTDKTETNYEYTFLVVVNPDKSYNSATVVILDNIANPSKEVKQIKEQNGWNIPF